MVGEIIYNTGHTTPNTHKFDTCRHRSENPEEYVTKTCCQSQTNVGYICRKIPINGVKSYHCIHCPVYEKKEELICQENQEQQK